MKTRHPTVPSGHDRAQRKSPDEKLTEKVPSLRAEGRHSEKRDLPYSRATDFDDIIKTPPFPFFSSHQYQWHLFVAAWP